MSTITEEFNTGNFAAYSRDTSKTFLHDIRTKQETLTNSTGSPVTWLVGTIMGRVTASSKLIPLASGASDGSQIPVGILYEEVTIPATSDLENVTICISGTVDGAGLVFDGSDDLTTMITGRTIEDRLNADTLGIKVEVSDELTKLDNI